MSLYVMKLHGCSGAGKTTVARALMASADKIDEVEGKNGKPEAYVCHFPSGTPLAILGSYRNNCGGMDSYSSKAEDIISLIKFYRESQVHVFFEGLLLSTYFGAVGKYMETMGDEAIFAFMDTPILTCLERVTRRRDVQQSKNKFNPQNTIDKYNTIEHLKKKCELNGRRVVTIAHDKDPISQMNAIFNNAS